MFRLNYKPPPTNYESQKFDITKMIVLDKIHCSGPPPRTFATVGLMMASH